LSVPRDCKTAVLAICQDFKLCFNPHLGLNSIEVKLNLNGQNNQGEEQTLKSAPGEEQIYQSQLVYEGLISRIVGALLLCAPTEYYSTLQP
jgi:hypothetical protein